MEVYLFSFEKLHVWQDAVAFAKTIYSITASFPADEKFGLVSQMRRATISISSNIAEGTGRSGNKDKAHFYQMAYTSAMELLSQSIVSHELGFLTTAELTVIRIEIEKIANKINALKKSIKV